MSGTVTSGLPPASPVAPSVSQTQDTLTESASASFQITAYAHALANITLRELPTQGDWFSTFNANLVTAQRHAQDWVQELGPAVFATIPQAIIDYSNVFAPATDDIMSILAQIKGVPTPAQQRQLNELLGALLTRLRSQQATLDALRKSLDGFFADIQQDHTNLLTGQHSAQQEILADTDLSNLINAKITQINAGIASDSAKALASEIGLGIAIFVTVVAIGLAVATEGAALPLVVAGVGLIGVGGAIAGTVIFTEKVNQDIDDLHDEQRALSDEQAQVSALQGISDTVGALVRANEQAQLAMTTVLDAWSVLETKLAGVVRDINQAQAPDIPAHIEALDLGTAQSDWQQLVSFATGMQHSAQSIAVQVAQPSEATR